MINQRQEVQSADFQMQMQGEIGPGTKLNKDMMHSLNE